jgi:hypothetical protein
MLQHLLLEQRVSADNASRQSLRREGSAEPKELERGHAVEKWLYNSDGKGAGVICEAVSRPNTRFVSIKSVEQLGRPTPVDDGLAADDNHRSSNAVSPSN